MRSKTTRVNNTIKKLCIKSLLSINRLTKYRSDLSGSLDYKDKTENTVMCEIYFEPAPLLR